MKKIIILMMLVIISIPAFAADDVELFTPSKEIIRKAEAYGRFTLNKQRIGYFFYFKGLNNAAKELDNFVNAILTEMKEQGFTEIRLDNTYEQLMLEKGKIKSVVLKKGNFTNPTVVEMFYYQEKIVIYWGKLNEKKTLHVFAKKKR